MGSVKDLNILNAPTREKVGRGRFIFSDRYSVFDWGEMPDHIDHKGSALCISAAYFFEKLERAGIPTHYLGLVEDDQRKNIDQINQPIHVLETRLFRVLEPHRMGHGGYDYTVYLKEKKNLLVPLEVIYRNALPAGSSVHKRLENGELTLDELGLTEKPKENIDLPNPYLDVSTKLEATDRYLTWQEAQQYSGLSDEKMREIKEVALKVNQMITKEVSRLGLKNEDGKFEFALNGKGEVVLVDVLGTLDECRFTYQGIPISKEIARLYYRKGQWYQEIVKAKEKDLIHWKSLVQVQPEPLPARLKELISYIYCGFTNEITGRNWFKGTPPLMDILQEIQQYV